MLIARIFRQLLFSPKTYYLFSSREEISWGIRIALTNIRIYLINFVWNNMYQNTNLYQ